MRRSYATIWSALGALVASGALFPIPTRAQKAIIPPLPTKTAPPQLDPQDSQSPQAAPASQDSQSPRVPDLTIPAPEPSPVPVTPPTLPALPSAGPLAGEVRAMWVVRDSLTSPQKIRNAVALAKKYGFNTLFVQVRGRGDAFYASRLEPRAEALSGQPADFDPLALVVEEGHRAGLQVHAWMNTFFVWGQKRRPYSALHVVNRHPEWLVQDKQGRIPWSGSKNCEGAFLDPALPEVRDYTRSVFLDVAMRYAVDGLHLDYVRFPSESYSFSTRALGKFREHLLSEHLLPALTPAQVAVMDQKAAKNRLAWYYSFPDEWRAWRQDLVTETVRTISQDAHRLRPGIVVSAAVFPGYEDALASKGQAWRDWLRDGWLDAACPMTYNVSTQTVSEQIRSAVASSYGRPIIAGVGAWRIPAASAIAKARAFRQIGAAGINFFSYNGMTREGTVESYLAAMRDALFQQHVARSIWRRPVATAHGD